MADRKIWTDDEKIVIHIGDDFFFDIFNSFMEPIYKWIAEGKERVALDNLAKAKLRQFKKNATTKNLKEMKEQIRAAAKAIPITPKQKDKLLRRSVSVPFDIGIRNSSITDVPSLPKKDAIIPKSLPETLSESDFAKLRDQYPINLQEFIDDPSAAAPSWEDQKEQLRRYGISQPDSQWLGPQLPRLGSTRLVRKSNGPMLSDSESLDEAHIATSSPRNLFENRRQIDPSIVKEIVQKTLTADPPFDKDKDIFHKIAYGISQLTGQDPSIGYDYPGTLSVHDREVRDYGAKKKGGKVKKKSKKKYTSKKKYSMNRGGIASVRKPTRA